MLNKFLPTLIKYDQEENPFTFLTYSTDVEPIPYSYARVINVAIEEGSLETLKILTSQLSIYVENLCKALYLGDLQKINWLADVADKQINAKGKLYREIYQDNELVVSSDSFGSWVKAVANRDLDAIERITLNVTLTEAHKLCANAFSEIAVFERIGECIRSLATDQRANKRSKKSPETQ